MKAWLCCFLFMFLCASGVSAGDHYPVGDALVQGWADAVKEGKRLSKDVSWAINFSREKGKVDRAAGLTLAAEELSRATDIVGVSFDFIKIEEGHGFYEAESPAAIASIRAYFKKSLGTIDERIGFLNGVLANASETVIARYTEKTRDYFKKARRLLEASLEQSQAFVRSKK